jgi:cob(I)alamin adenosyltransferase
MEVEKGIVMLFTGNGKGKTTASLGAGMRAAGHGAKVFMIQFMKGRLYGEIAASAGIDGFTIEQHGRDEFVDPESPEKIDMELARRGWGRVLELIEAKEPDLLILDEINIAISFGLLDLSEVIEMITARPQGLDIILTGRYAPDELIELADTVTEMKEIKHHYNSGIQMRKGIEY